MELSYNRIKSLPNEYQCRLRWRLKIQGGKMLNDRRRFIQLAGTTADVAGTAWAAAPATAQTTGQFKAIKALAFDAYGTLFDVFSVTAFVRAALSRQRQPTCANLPREAVAIQSDA